MLVLSRKRNEEIVINGGTPQEVTITVVEIRGDKVRLGIQAAKETSVHRREVFEAIQRENARSAVSMRETAVIDPPVQCCERDHDHDGNCDRHPELVNCPICNTDGKVIAGSACGKCRDGKVTRKEAAMLRAPTSLGPAPLAAYVKKSELQS